MFFSSFRGSFHLLPRDVLYLVRLVGGVSLERTPLQTHSSPLTTPSFLSRVGQIILSMDGKVCVLLIPLFAWNPRHQCLYSGEGGGSTIIRKNYFYL